MLPKIPNLSAPVHIPASMSDLPDGSDSPKILALVCGSGISIIIACAVHQTQPWLPFELCTKTQF